MDVKNIFDKYKEFGDAEKDVKALLGAENQFKNAVRVIRRLSSIVNSAKSPYPKRQMQSLKNICKLSSQVIVRDKIGDVLEVDNQLTAAMYQIARVMIEMDDYLSFTETVSGFVDVLEYMPASGDGTQLHILRQFSILFYKSFKQLQQYLLAEKHVDVDSEIIPFWELMLRVCNLSRQWFFIVFYLAENIVTFYSKKVGFKKGLEVPLHKIVLSLKLFFDKSKTNNMQDPNLGKLLHSSMSTSLVYFHTFIKMSEFEQAVMVLKDMIEILETIFPESSPESKVVETLEKLLNPFLFSLETPPSGGLFHSEVCESVTLLDQVLTESTMESDFKQRLAYFVSSVLVALKYYWGKDIKKAKPVFPISVIPALEEFFSKLTMVVEKGALSACVDSSGQRCALTADVPLAFYLEQILLLFPTYFIDWNMESQPILLRVCENSFKRSERFLRIATEKNCYQSTKMTLSLCEDMYLVANHCQSSYHISRPLLEKSKALYLSISKTTDEVYLSRKSLPKCIMTALSNVLKSSKETTSACQAAAIAVAVHLRSPQLGDTTLLKLWSELVAELPDQDTSLVTLMKSVSELEDFFAEYNENTIDWAELFVWEMTALGSYGAHKSGVLLTRWKARKGLRLSPLQQMKGASYFLRGLAFSPDLTTAKEILSDFKTEKYKDLLKTISWCDRPVALCNLAELCYFRFFVAKRLHQALSKEFVDKAKTFKPLPKIVLSTTDVVDKNDLCDLPPTYPSLTISEEVPLLTMLDAALTYWDEALEKGLEASLLSRRERESSAQYLAEAAMFCRLSGHYLKEKRAWEICRRFGERFENNLLIVRAISGLMDMCCCDGGWIERGQAIAATLEDEPTAKEVLHIFKHSNVVQCFVNSKEDEAAVLLKELVRTDKTLSWYNIRSKLLLGRYLLDTPRSKRRSLFPDERETPLSILRNCNLITKSLIDLKLTSGLSGGVNRITVIEHYALVDLYFSSCLLLGYTYLEMMLPREARCFLKCGLPLSQRFGLPVRTAECLSLLGKVDLLVQKIEDGAVKIEGIKNILEVDSSIKEEPAIEVPVYQDDDQRLRIASKGRNELGASPTLPVVTFSMPDFVSHKSSCSCYHCSHVLLQKMWLDMCYIQASICTTQFQVKLATSFFCNGIRLAEKFRYKQEKLLNGFAGRYILLEDFHRSETSLRFKYADLLTLYSKDTEAWKVNEKVFASLKRFQLKDALLLTEVKEQKISLIDIANPPALPRETEPRQKPEMSVKSGAYLTPNIELLKRSNNALKTPLRSQNQKGGSRTPLKAITPLQSVLPIREKCFLPPRGVVPPVLVFSDSDEESPLPTPKSANAAKVKDKSSRATVQKKESRAKSASAKINRVELSESEDEIGQRNSKDCSKIGSQRLRRCRKV